MENHHNEEPKPSNKWVATPIVMAICIISLVVFFITLGAKGKSKSNKQKDHGTEQHATANKEDRGEVKNNETSTDTTKITNENEEHGH